MTAPISSKATNVKSSTHLEINGCMSSQYSINTIHFAQFFDLIKKKI